ncbi:hypothetical protein JYK14_12780 [Siccirubricoccus sp. KC 17139]|uniref:Capsule biosynthesis protein n=1 Tax=Siccirubricoccus soli TaxID=2899147 RepID=A0ABT1D7S3_9PROT|nr:hypothetical protein [Siccirubricoccus soli]MCO6417030.1 hypothetical protein [Siccirubricoccus soli]MCP2683165.1 hypothetical protein [Siccirubricoccus soli]
MSLTLLPPKPGGGARPLSGRGLLEYLGRLLPAPAEAEPEAPPTDPVAVEIARIAASGLFDALWFVEQHPEAAKARDAIAWQVREAPLAAPHPLFDVAHYIVTQPDWRLAAVTPLGHYLRCGAATGASPHPLFDPAWYAAQVPGVPAAQLFRHYLTEGFAAGLSPHPAFDPAYYGAQIPGLRAAGVNPLTHFVQLGAAEGISPNPLFDPAWYAECYQPAGNPLVHFLTVGAAAGAQPHPRLPAEPLSRWLARLAAGEAVPGACATAEPGEANPTPTPVPAEPSPAASEPAAIEGPAPDARHRKSLLTQIRKTVQMTVLKPQQAAEPALVSSAGGIVFTGDLLRVDDHEPKRLANPQATNIAWIHALFGPLLREITGRASRAFVAEDYPNPLARLSVYRRLQREFSSAGWASLYAELDDAALEEEIASRFAGNLVITYEMPPYLRQIFDRHGIGFIDLTIHPIRYLPDYVFGIRSNVPAVSRRLHALQVPPRVFADFARLSAARTVRVFRRTDLEPGAALFIGQMNHDSSLIHRGRMYETEDVEAALFELSSRYPKVYYKVHPHRRDAAELKGFVASLPRCEWIDANIYDLLARPEIEVVASLSSGTLMEAPFFQRPIQRYIDRPLAVDVTGATHEEVFEKGQYVAAPPAIFEAPYWAYILGHSEAPPPLQHFDVTRDALRTTLNMKWGR